MHKISRLNLGLLTSLDDLWLLPQLFLLLARHNGHQQGDGYKALGAGAQPHKGRGHNDGLAVHHAQQGLLYAQLGGNAPQGKHHPGVVVELGVHRAGAVAEFGLRRAQGPDGGLAVARASYVAGCSSTSNVLAGRRYGIPVFGTHAHSWVMSFDSELEAFRAFAKSSPKNCTLLIDTYDVREGCEHAITVAKEMEAAGERLSAIRIDSGDLAKLSKYVRGRFDAEGLPYVGISVSNDLDEYTIQSLLDQGAPIDSFGVGTKLATCYDQPALGGVYKLSARRASDADPWTPVVKLSEQPYKRTIPGVQRVRRYYDGFGGPVCDMIYDEDHLAGEGAARGNTLVAVNDAALVTDVSELEYRELLVPIVRDGGAVAPRESIEDARERCAWAIDHLDAAFKRFLYPQTYVVGMEQGLAQVRDELVRKNMAAASAFPWAK